MAAGLETRALVKSKWSLQDRPPFAASLEVTSFNSHLGTCSSLNLRETGQVQYR